MLIPTISQLNTFNTIRHFPKQLVQDRTVTHPRCESSLLVSDSYSNDSPRYDPRHFSAGLPELCCFYFLITLALSTSIMRKKKESTYILLVRDALRANRLLVQRLLTWSLNLNEKKITSL